MERAQDTENFCYALFHDLRRHLPGRLDAPDDEALDFQVVDMAGIRHLDWALDVKEKLFKGGKDATDTAGKLRSIFKKGFMGNPFALRAPDPIRVVYEKDFSLVAEIGLVDVATLNSVYPDKKADFEDIVSDLRADNKEAAEEHTVPFYHIETKDYIYEAIRNDKKGDDREDLMLRTTTNVAGRPRYAFAAGQRGSGDKPWQKFRPLIAPLYPLAQLHNITGTLLMTGALQTGRRPYQLVDDGAQADDFMSLSVRPGEETNIAWVDPSNPQWPEAPAGKKWEPVPIPDQSILLQAHQQIEREIVAFGFPPILSPAAEIDATSGYDRSRQMEGAQDFLEPALQNIAASWHEIFMLALDTLRAIDVPVTIPLMQIAQGEDVRFRPPITIDPKELEDIHLEVRFESIPAVTQFGIDEANRRDVELGFMSRSRYMATKYDDPIKEAKQVDLDRVGAAASELATTFVIDFIKQQAPQIGARVAAEQNIPMSAQPPQNGADPARPEGGALPGVGAPIVPPVQTQPGQPAPGTGDQAVGVAQ